MSRADLVICGGLVEGVWPGNAAPDSLLPPPVLRVLGVPGADFRIGLSAHDLAAALGAPEVVLSYALRDEGAPVVPSRFVLRVQALMGELADRHRETEAVQLARAIDHADPAPVYPRPKPLPSPEQRKVSVSATGLDRLRSDPYQFYASSILGLRAIDGLDAVPSPAWQGSAAHDIMQAWHEAGEPDGELHAIAVRELDKMSAHPLMRALWRPRLMAALDWIGEQIAQQKGEGRTVALVEQKGKLDYDGVTIHARADRIDALPDGEIAIVDYKTGTPPTPRRVEEGFSLQLGLTGFIASRGGFADLSGTPTRFEYWSFAKNKVGGFGYVQEPVRDADSRRKTGPMREEFLTVTKRYLDDALGRWILGSDPFTARLNPDIGGYNDFDQLMRLDEWLPHMTAEDWNEA
jgi:ATP-dependent helicase/nuclease subunit B